MRSLHSADPLPGFVRGADVIRRAADAWRPPRQTAVSEWAEVDRQLRNPGGYSGPWRNSKTPYLVEPMDRSSSRVIEALIMLGPSQFAKTELGLNILGHAVCCRPRDALVVQYSRDMAIEFFDDRLQQKMISPSPAIRERLGVARRDDKVMQKRFSNGMRIVAGWPVAGQLAGRPVPIVWLDERDRMPSDVNGEGDPFELGKKRTTTFGRNALSIATSSPRGLHPADAGEDTESASPILVLYFDGDQNLWFWPCAGCGEYWSPGFDADRKPITSHLWIPEGADPVEARDRATLICPVNGCEILEADKAAMNAGGVWLPKGTTIDAGGKISGARPMTRTASYWFVGLASPFRTIGQIAEEWVKAENVFKKTGDEELLKTCFNTAFGFPYRPRLHGALPLAENDLEGRREDYKLGTVPAGVKFLTAAVDVGIRRFSIQVDGWNEDAESWLVDRIEVTEEATGAELDPANVAAHWHQLQGLLIGKVYPLAADPGRGLPIANVAVDTGGAAGEDAAGDPTEGVSGQAKEFARKLFAAGLDAWRLTLVKGAAARTAPMLPKSPTWETDDNGKRLKNAVPVYVIGQHALKNMIDNRLRLTKPGPGYRHFPADPPVGHFAEMTAERKKKGRWIRTGANESWDLTVYNELARQRLRPERIEDWEHPPAWAALREISVGTAPAAAPPAARRRRRRR